MKRTKLISILAASLVLITGLTGCGKNATATNDTSTVPERIWRQLST